MPRKAKTREQLQKEIRDLNRTITYLYQDKNDLLNEIEKIKADKEVVTLKEFNQVLKAFDEERNLKKLLHTTCDDLKNKIKTYSKKHDKHIRMIENLKNELEAVKRQSDVQELKGEQKAHNERGAGRKSKLSEDTKDIIRFKYSSGVASMNVLAKEFEVSKGTIYNIIHAKK